MSREGRMGVLFIGEFPPPHGGVTIKNDFLIKEMFIDIPTARFDLYRFKRKPLKAPVSLLELVGSIARADRIVIGVGHSARIGYALRLVRLIRGKDYLGRVTVFSMGRTLPEHLMKFPWDVPLLTAVRCIFAESEKLVESLFRLGCSNARFLPNVRSCSGALPPRPVGEVVRFVFFAQVRREKGVDTLIQAVRRLNDAGFGDRFDVSVYGDVVEGYKEEFRRLLDLAPNVRYMGVFDTSNRDVYAELNRYDSSVSSSSWEEGMSGSNVECKFAGIANIVSNAGFNPECVTDGWDGILVKPRDIEDLADAMRALIENHGLLEQMKRASFDSRVMYDATAWRDTVVGAVMK